MREAGYTNEELKILQKSNTAKYGEANSNIDGRMYNKIGAYIDEMRKDVYYLERDRTYAVTDNVANSGRITTIQGSSTAIKAINGLKVGSRVIGITAIGIDLYYIYTSGFEARTITTTMGGWAGAYAGAWIGGKTGAYLGGEIGSLFGGAGAAPGALIGGFVGGIGGGIGGYFWGHKMTETFYDYVVRTGVQPGTK